MKHMTSKEIRHTWLRFFEEHGHKIEESSSLIPRGDKTLLWINAGVAPLKKYFDGSELPPSKRLANIQKCIRTNDIENVGLTARHHTFFEMMGNFSIGDYFKDEAIEMGLEILTSPKYYNLDINKLYMTYYPTDTHAKDKWLSLGIKEDHLIASFDNYWEIGEGPSGPCTEIFYDRGESYDKRGTELIRDDIENERYIEIWNIVFSQYNAKAGLDRSEYKELPNKNIDTGAGLERFACVLQETETNFETDLFMPIIKKLESISKIPYQGQMSYKVISDHIKTLVMAISDGAVLSNEGRGYVLRRLLRRALKHGRILGINRAFLKELTPQVEEIMGEFYPNIIENRYFVNKVIESEEKKFLETLETGEALIEKIVKEKGSISKDDSFTLFDTYGFPIELQEEYALDHGIKIDKEGFFERLEEQKEKSRAARKETQSMHVQDEAFLLFKEPSLFVGYDQMSITTEVIKVFDDGIVLKETPFYATMGGQVADKGKINGYDVLDVIKMPNGQHLHKVDAHFDEGEMVLAVVDEPNRFKIMQNHTATHLVHRALKDTLGDHVNQQGSLVSSELLRFDFNHYESPSTDNILKIEKIVKDYIRKDVSINIDEMSYKEAINKGAMALFGEKYGDVVRVVNIDDYSIELCGGTHVKKTKEIDKFLISSVASIGSGIYRIEAFSGKNFLDDFMHRNASQLSEQKVLFEKYNSLIKDFENRIHNTSSSTKEEEAFIKETKQKINGLTIIQQGSYSDTINLRETNQELKRINKEIEKQINQFKHRFLGDMADEYIKNNLSGNVLTIYNEEMSMLRALLFQVYDKIKVERLCLINITDERVTYLVRSSLNDAHAIIKQLNERLNGSGGGRGDFAQGGSAELDKIHLIKEEMEKL